MVRHLVNTPKASLLVLALALVAPLAAGCVEDPEEDLELAEESAELSAFAASIQNVWSQKCLDIPWGSNRQGEAVNQFNCHGGGAQRFRVELVWGVPGQTATGWQIRNTTTNLCLRPNGASAPGFTPESISVSQWPCDGHWAVWRKRDVVALSGGERLSFSWDRDAAYCLDVPANRAHLDGVQLQIYRGCHGGALQRFDVRP